MIFTVCGNDAMQRIFPRRRLTALTDVLRRSLLARAIGALALLLVPLVAAIFVTIHSLSAASETAQKQLLLYTATALAEAVESQLQRYRALGEMLSSSEALLANDLASFRRQARPLLQSQGMSVVLHDGPQQILNTLTDDITLPQRSAEGYRMQQQAVELGRPVVSDVYTGSLRQTWVITIEFPPAVVAGGRYALTLVIDLDPFLKTLNTASVSKDWIVGIADGNGRFVAGFPGKRNAGNPISPHWKQHLRVPGLAEFNSLEGLRIVNANALVDGTNWTVGVGIRRDRLDAAIHRSINDVLFVTFGLIAGLLVAAVVFAKQFAARIAALQSALLARLSGDRASPAHVPLEFQDLWQGVSAAADERRRATEMLDASLQGMRAAQDELQRSSQVLQAISDLSPDLLYAKDLERKLRFVSRSAINALQKPMSEILGRDERDVLSDPSEIAKIQEHDARVLAGETVTEEEPLTAPNGSHRIFLSTKLPWRDGDGNIIGILGISVDITERRIYEDRLQFVMREVSHRAKNMLAIVQAVARSSGRTASSTTAFMQSFENRLLGMSRSMDLLVQNDWRGVDLETLVRSQLEPFVGHLDDRLRINGPPVQLSAPSAQTFGMVVHELATNAGKYGALSTARGNVCIGWSLTQAEFRLYWKESGGPPVTTPTRKGFGTAVLSTLLRSSFECSPEFRYDPEGFTWTMTCERSEIESSGHSTSSNVLEDVL